MRQKFAVHEHLIFEKTSTNSVRARVPFSDFTAEGEDEAAARVAFAQGFLAHLRDNDEERFRAFAYLEAQHPADASADPGAS